MIEIVVVGSPIRHGYRRVQVGMSAFVDEAMAAALVSGGRAVYKTPPAPVEAAPSEDIAAVEEPAPTEADKPAVSPADKPKKRSKR